MLHITVGESEERLLRKSNQFPQDDIMNFCLILSYGKIKDLENQEYREIPINTRKLIPWKVNVKEKLKELEEMIKHNLIKITKIQQEINSIGESVEVKYISAHIDNYK